MNLTYDPRYNTAYFRLWDKTEEVESVKVTDDLNVDVAPDGTVYGIELLNANGQLGGLIAGKLVLENEETGTRTEVALP